MMILNTRSALVAAIFSGLLMLGLSPSSHALRCGNHVIAEDAHISEVISECGEPLSEINKKEYVTTYISKNYYPIHTQADSAGRAEREVTREIQITELIYDFGLERFKRKLRFVDGHLDKVTQLGRGSAR